jgi:hypothetical protein
MRKECVSCSAGAEGAAKNDAYEELKDLARKFHLLQQSPHLRKSVPRKWREVTGAREARRVEGSARKSASRSPPTSFICL